MNGKHLLIALLALLTLPVVFSAANTDVTGNYTALTAATHNDAGEYYDFTPIQNFSMTGFNVATVFTGQNWTISVWAKSIEENNSRSVYNADGSGADRFYWRQTTTPNQMVIGLGSWNDVQLTTMPGVNVWAHYLIRLNGTTGTIYVNGTLKDTQASITLSYPSVVLPFAGPATGAVEFWNGSLDDIRIFLRAVDDSEVTALYNNQTITNGLIAWFPMQDESCGYYMGTWNVAAADACVISSSVNVLNNPISITGTGSFTVGSGGRVYNFTSMQSTMSGFCGADDGTIG